MLSFASLRNHSWIPGPGLDWSEMHGTRCRRSQAAGWGPARPRPRGWRQRGWLARAGYIAGTVAVVVAVVVSLGAYAIYRRLDGNISVAKVSHLSGRSVYGVQNILLLGSQTRDGQRRGDLGSNPALDTSNSDNLLLVHMDPAHTHAIVLSIPRDTMVYGRPRSAPWWTRSAGWRSASRPAATTTRTAA